MSINFLAPLRGVKRYVATNKKLYLFSLVVVLSGVVLGAYFVLSDLIDGEVYTRVETDLNGIILGDWGFLSLVLENIWTLTLPMLVNFLLCLNHYTKFLSFFYLGFQGILLGASIFSMVLDAGLAGILSMLFLVLPINALNFMVIVSWVIICYKREVLKRTQRLSLGYSLSIMVRPMLMCMIGAVSASVAYGVLYPLLLRSAIVVL